jgi:DNA-binding transcriptional ArsR family regulator
MSLNVFDALGNPVRREILVRLRREPLAVADIAAEFSISRPAISRHLSLLEQAGLIQRREEGARNIYAIRMQGFASVRAFLDEFWDDALTRMQRLARE